MFSSDFILDERRAASDIENGQHDFSHCFILVGISIVGLIGGAD